MVSTVPFEGHNRQMQALNAFIVARTGLPLCDLLAEPASDWQRNLSHKQMPDTFYITDLHQYLTAHSIKKLIIAGIQTELCIDTIRIEAEHQKLTSSINNRYILYKQKEESE